MDTVQWAILIAAVVLVVILGGGIFVLVTCYQKATQGVALIRTGIGGTKVSFTGIVVVPILHRLEVMDVSVKRVEIDRMAENGLICRDNMRADVKVAFFVRVNSNREDVLHVARSLGCRRASEPKALVEFFDAKFSEGLKTVGKQFDFVDLYTNRLQFKEEILKVIGTDLNGYVLDDAAIDFLEQTPIQVLKPDNILDAEGIKKITELTAQQAILANQIAVDKEKTITKQNVEAREAILELERQQAEAEQKQKREITEITARQEAEAKKVQEEERLKAESARIASDEQLQVAEENKNRQIVVAAKNRERTEKVETERVEKDRQIEAVERERVVTLAAIEKEKAVEVEKRNIQEVIRERVAVERTVVEQEEKIQDTKAFAAADRTKQVAVTKAQEEAEQALVKKTKEAEAAKEASKHRAEQVVIEAEAQRSASEKEADARKILADATAQEEAVHGMGEARALEAKATATEQFGAAEASVIEKKAAAEAKGVEAMAEAKRKDGSAEADVMRQKYNAEAQGITEKAEAMKLFDGVGREHEEFKLRLRKDLDVEIAQIDAQKHIADHQAQVLGEAFKRAKIDIVGGESTFFDQIAGAIAGGKAVDRYVDNSQTLGTIRDTFFTGDPKVFKAQLKNFVDKFGISTEEIKNLTVSAALAKMAGLTDDTGMKQLLDRLGGMAQQTGMGKELVSKFL